MSEYEASLPIAVSADRLFAVLRDPEQVPRWVPVIDEASSSGPDALHVEGEVGDRDTLWRAQDDQRRVEWGSRGTGEYAGWVQVYESGTDADACEAVIHLSLLGDQPQTHGGQAAKQVDDELREALQRLADLVAR